MTNQLCQQQKWSRLYKEVLRQITGYETTVTDEYKWIELAFGVTVKAWFGIQQKIDDYLFKDQQEEIRFYKMVKPRFIGLIDYFTLIYKSVLFQPEETVSKNEYWINELAICKNFLSKHQSFCRYYEQGNTGMDHVYFVHEKNQQPLTFGINENNWHVITSYSYLLARVIAIKKYNRYIEEKISFQNS